MTDMSQPDNEMLGIDELIAMVDTVLAHRRSERGLAGSDARAHWLLVDDDPTPGGVAQALRIRTSDLIPDGVMLLLPSNTENLRERSAGEPYIIKVEDV